MGTENCPKERGETRAVAGPGGGAGLREDQGTRPCTAYLFQLRVTELFIARVYCGKEGGKPDHPLGLPAQKGELRLPCLSPSVPTPDL